MALNVALWTGVTGVVLEYWKKKGSKWESLLMNGLLEKGLVSAISSYLTAQNIPLIGGDFSSSLIYNGIVSAVAESIRHKGSNKLQAAEEQILCAIIGKRLAQNFGGAYNSIYTSVSGYSSYFLSSSGYTGAQTPGSATGTGIPSTVSGNPMSGMTGMSM